VYVEKRMTAKLRPHQRDGVAFMFYCLAGLKDGGYTGSILMDGMGLGKFERVFL
jgi:SNF2 family DNA or RNA helicase